MNTEDTGLVVGVFPTREQAQAATAALLRFGHATDGVEVVMPTSGRYRVQNRVAREIASAVAIGVAAGGLLGGWLGLALLPAAMPSIFDHVVAVAISVSLGVFWGAFYGGVIGVASRVVIGRVHEDRWWEASPVGREIVVIARAESRASTTRRVMGRVGAHCFLTEAPTGRPVDDPLVAA